MVLKLHHKLHYRLTITFEIDISAAKRTTG